MEKEKKWQIKFRLLINFNLLIYSQFGLPLITWLNRDSFKLQAIVHIKSRRLNPASIRKSVTFFLLFQIDFELLWKLPAIIGATVEAEMERFEMLKIAHFGWREECYTIFITAKLLYLFKFSSQSGVGKSVRVFLIQLE